MIPAKPRSNNQDDYSIDEWVGLTYDWFEYLRKWCDRTRGDQVAEMFRKLGSQYTKYVGSRYWDSISDYSGRGTIDSCHSHLLKMREEMIEKSRTKGRFKSLVNAVNFAIEIDEKWNDPKLPILIWDRKAERAFGAEAQEEWQGVLDVIRSTFCDGKPKGYLVWAPHRDKTPHYHANHGNNQDWHDPDAVLRQLEIRVTDDFISNPSIEMTLTDIGWEVLLNNLPVNVVPVDNLISSITGDIVPLTNYRVGLTGRHLITPIAAVREACDCLNENGLETIAEELEHQCDLLSAEYLQRTRASEYASAIIAEIGKVVNITFSP